MRSGPKDLRSRWWLPLDLQRRHQVAVIHVFTQVVTVDSPTGLQLGLASAARLDVLDVRLEGKIRIVTVAAQPLVVQGRAGVCTEAVLFRDQFRGGVEACA